MCMKKITILEENFFFLYENNKVKKWSFNFEQAEFFIIHRSSNDIRTSFLKKTIHLDKALSNWQPHEAITFFFYFA